MIHLWGRTEDDRTFLVLDDREVPAFWIPADRTDDARLAAARVESETRRAMDGRPLARVVLARPSDARATRRRLEEAGIECLEADVRFTTRFLTARGIRGGVEIAGEAEAGDGVDLVFRNPDLAPARATPRLRVLSFDIETDPRAERLLSVALHGCGASEVLLLTPEGMSSPGATPFRDQAALLRAFVDRVVALDPDVLTGWNVVDFDLTVLQRLGREHGVPMALGRGGRRLWLRESRSVFSSRDANVPGRVVADGLDLVRGAFVRLDGHSLDAVARQVLGEGKTITGGDRGRAILEAWESDRERFVEYNLRDARLVLDILDSLSLIELATERSLLTGLPIDRVAGSIAAFDHLYLSRLAQRGVVAPSVRSGAGEANLGGEVLEPRVGLWRHVVVFDFKSLYPSVVRTFQIDPLGFVPDPEPDEDWIRAPNGAAFRREPGILPEILDELFPRREAAKKAGDTVASHAIKILMNSFYGVLGASACRFHRPELAGAITAFGRQILGWSRDWFEAAGHPVLYGDTDSLFVESGEDSAREARRVGEALLARLQADLAIWVRETQGVESRLELELERVYLRLLLPQMRGGRGGARKRYAGLLDDDRVVFTGMEAVRRDWTDLAHRVQTELYERLFRDRDVEDWLRREAAAVRSGERDDELVYRKALRKRLDEYTATTPPHVAAARKLEGDPDRIVEYLITVAGPEPTAALASPVDREHYVQKQVRPVAEPVLGVLGLDFDRVVGDDAQLELFPFPAR